MESENAGSVIQDFVFLCGKKDSKEGYFGDIFLNTLLD